MMGLGREAGWASRARAVQMSMPGMAWRAARKREPLRMRERPSRSRRK